MSSGERARLVLVVPAFPQLSETFIVTKAVGLVARGWDVQIVCGRSTSEQWSAFGAGHPVNTMRGRVNVTPDLSPGIRLPLNVVRSLRPLHQAEPGTIRRYLTDRSCSLGRRARDLVVDATILGLRPDVVHFEFGSLAVGRTHLGRRADAALSVSFRGYDLNYVGLAQSDHYREVWADADAIHVLGQDLWRRAVHRGAPEDLPHAVIPPAMDTSTAVPIPARPGALGTADNPLRLLSVGRLHWKKGHQYALDAVAMLQDRGLHLRYRVVGNGPLQEAVAFWRHQLGLDDIVELLGAVPPAEVSRHLFWADVFVHPATSEGFCNAVIEAQAHGVPVVCSDADGLAENVEDGVTGLVVPRRDPEALANAIADLAADGPRREATGRAGPDRVQRRFRIQDQLDAWERFYHEVLHPRSRLREQVAKVRS